MAGNNANIAAFFPWNTAAVGASIKDIDVALLDGSLDSYYGVGLCSRAVLCITLRSQNPHGVSGFLRVSLPFALTLYSATLPQGKEGRSGTAPRQRWGCMASGCLALHV